MNEIATGLHDAEFFFVTEDGVAYSLGDVLGFQWGCREAATAVLTLEIGDAEVIVDTG